MMMFGKFFICIFKNTVSFKLLYLKSLYILKGLVSHQIDSYENFAENITEFVRGHEGRFNINVYHRYETQDKDEMNVD